jgi:hypothetical protein
MSSQTALPILLAPPAYEQRNEQQFRSTLENRLRGVEQVTDPLGRGISDLS